MKVHHLSAHEILAEHGAVLVRVLDGEALSCDHVDRACEILDEMLTRFAAVGLVLVLEHGTPLMDPETVRYIRERFDPYGDRVVVVPIVLGLGFWRSAVLRAAAQFPKSGHTVLPSVSLEHGAEALARELVGIDPGAIIAVCEQLRLRLRCQR